MDKTHVFFLNPSLRNNAEHLTVEAEAEFLTQYSLRNEPLNYKPISISMIGLKLQNKVVACKWVEELIKKKNTTHNLLLNLICKLECKLPM